MWGDECESRAKSEGMGACWERISWMARVSISRRRLRYRTISGVLFSFDDKKKRFWVENLQVRMRLNDVNQRLK